jgi:hypothetical protein
MSRRSARIKDKSTITVQYVNVVLGGVQGGPEPRDHWDVLKDMELVLLNLPLLKQIGGTCVPYSIRTAVQLADMDPNIPPPVCTSKNKKEGAQMRHMLSHLKNKNDVKGKYAKEYNTPIARNNDIIVDILEDLEKGNIVVAGGGLDVAYANEIYRPPKVKGFESGDDRLRTVKNMIPVFNNYRSAAQHNICIIGCYNDKIYGPSFLTKMTNCREYPIKSMRVRGVDLKAEHLSYGVLCIKDIQNGPFYLSEYATLPMAANYDDLKFMNMVF